MRLIHWVQIFSPGNVSGMITSIRELLEAEIRVLGVKNVGICDAVQREGKTYYNLTQRSLPTLPWSSALSDPDAVHIIHTYCPQAIYDMKRKIFFSHGTPEYIWWDDIYRMSPPVWWQMTTLARQCDATVCWFKRDTEFWEELTKGKVRTIRRGVDLSYWVLEGNRLDLYGTHPHLLYADANRLLKLPFTLLFAIKKVQRVYPLAYLKLILTDPPRDVAWSNLVTRLDIEHFVPISFGMIPDLRDLYRSVDMGVSPVMWGLLSRVPMELMASGTPVICYRGTDDQPIHGIRVEDSPEALAGGIIKLWERIQADLYGERLKARKVAEKNYDIRNSAKDLIKVCEEVM